MIVSLAVAAPPVSPHKGSAASSEKKDDTGSGKKDELKDTASATKHSIKINGKELRYVATAGKLVMKDDEGKPKAQVFYVAYTKDGEDVATRVARYIEYPWQPQP